MDAGTPDADVFSSWATCDRPNIGPRSTWNEPLETSPWELVMPAGADGGVLEGPLDGGADAGAARVCRSMGLSGFPGVRCSGAATVQDAQDGPVLVLVDGSRLEWSAAGASVAPPAIVAGDTVWVEYVHDVQIVCPFCGTYWNDEIEIREARDGRLLWAAREGHDLADVDDALVEELFGTSAQRSKADCTWTFTAGCSTVERTAFDRRLMTTPPQDIPHGALERVSTPKGEYDVLWAYTEERRVASEPLCSDGPGLASATGFAASWIATTDGGG